MAIKKTGIVKKAVEPKVEVATEESTAKKEFRAFIETYKAAHPAKYVTKEAELLKQLNSL
jgi:FMN-dependent NADH-azoreductase